MDVIVDLKLKINITTTKGNINELCLGLTIIFVIIILLVSSYDLSFALKDNKKDITSITTNNTKEILNVELNSYVQDDIENSLYPNQFYTCGYPQQLITDYNSLAKFNCQ